MEIIKYKQKKIITEEFVLKNKDFLTLEICHFLKENINFLIIKYKNIYLTIDTLFNNIKNINQITVILKRNDDIAERINTNKYLRNYYIYRKLLKSDNTNNYNKYIDDIQKKIIMNFKLENFILYNLFYEINNKSIPVIMKKEGFTQHYRIYTKTINKNNSIIVDDKYDNYISFNLLIEKDKYININIHYDKSYISFLYKKDYKINIENIIKKVQEIINLEFEYIIEKDIITKIVYEKYIDIKILYLILKTNEIYNKIITINEFSSILLLKNIITCDINLYSLNSNLHIKIIDEKIEFIISNIENRDFFNNIINIINNIMYYYDNYDKAFINKLFIDLNKNKYNKICKSRIKMLRNIDPNLFIPGYTKHATVNFNFIDDKYIKNKEKLIEEGILIEYNSKYYIADHGTKIKLKKNNKLPNKESHPYIISSCKNHKNNIKKDDKNKIKNKIHKYKYTILNEFIMSEINPLFLMYFNIKNKFYLRLGMNEMSNSFINCINISTSINIKPKYKYNLNYYNNINIIICNIKNNEEISFNLNTNNFNKYKLFILVFRYDDLENLNIKKVHNELLLYKKHKLIRINNDIIKKILILDKGFKTKMFTKNINNRYNIKNYKNVNKKIKIPIIISQYVYKGKCTLIKIKQKPNIWISYNDEQIDNIFIEKNIDSDLITFNEIKEYVDIIYYDIKDNMLYGCWYYYNNILVYTPVKIINFENKIKENNKRAFTNIDRINKYNKIQKIGFNYFLYDIVILMFREYLKKNKNIDKFINKYLIQYNFETNRNLIINTKITKCENIINYYINIIPELFHENKIKIPDLLYYNITSFLLYSETQNFNPIFFTPNMCDDINENNNIITCYTKNEFDKFIELIN